MSESDCLVASAAYLGFLDVSMRMDGARRRHMHALCEGIVALRRLEHLAMSPIVRPCYMWCSTGDDNLPGHLWSRLYKAINRSRVLSVDLGTTGGRIEGLFHLKHHMHYLRINLCVPFT